jgi:hypothetical protein
MPQHSGEIWAISDKNGRIQMEVELGRYASKYLSSVILTVCIISPSLANAQQIAKGIVQLSITASSQSISITSATCEIELLTNDPNTKINFTEDVTVQAQVANNVVKCTMVAPYNWSLTALTEPIYIVYSVSGVNGAVVTNTTGGGFDTIPASTTGTISLNLSTVF